MSERFESEDLERMLADALRPIEPPERLGGRVETTLSKLTGAAANELSWWADELSETELQSLRDPAQLGPPGGRGRRRRRRRHRAGPDRGPAPPPRRGSAGVRRRDQARDRLEAAGGFTPGARLAVPLAVRRPPRRRFGFAGSFGSGPSASAAIVPSPPISR